MLEKEYKEETTEKGNPQFRRCLASDDGKTGKMWIDVGFYIENKGPPIAGCENDMKWFRGAPILGPPLMWRQQLCLWI